MRSNVIHEIFTTMLLAAFLVFGEGGDKAQAQATVSTEAGLRKAVAEFYTLLKARRNVEAERLVTSDTLERFRSMPNGEFLSAQIQSIQFSNDEKSAIVNIGLLVSAANVPVPFELPRKTEWRLEAGGWRIVIPPPPEDGTTSMFKNSASLGGDRPKLDLEFGQPIVDLTPIKQGDKKIAKFAFTNSSAHPVTIVNVEADCGCVAMKTEQRTYKPGETGQLELEFDSTKYAYEFGQTVAVITEPGSQRINLLLRASVAPRN
jgi:hypothetical protein